MSNTEELRKHLFAAVRTQNWDEFEQLCQGNQQAIKEVFPQWMRVPEALRNDEAALQAYGNGLITVAQYFQEQLGVPDLLLMLQGDSPDNPIGKWQGLLGQAQQHMAEARFEEAEAVLNEALQLMEGTKGSGSDLYTAVTRGLIGQTYFHRGRVEEAVPPITTALITCRRSKDVEGIVAYGSALYDINRYLGRNGAAATLANELAELMASVNATADARLWQNRATMMNQGEPLVRVVAYINGMHLELEDIDRVQFQQEISLNFAYERNRPGIGLAQHHLNQGQVHGSQGKYDEALAEFKKAAEIDKYDPHAWYLQGLTFLNQRKYDDAVAAYNKTEELAPGWFQVRADLNFAQKLAEGKWPHELWFAIYQATDAEGTLETKIEMCNAWLAKHPDAAPLHLIKGECLKEMEKPGDAATAYEAGLAADPDVDTKTRLLTGLGQVSSTDQFRQKAFNEAIALNGNLTSAAMARILRRLQP